MPHKIVSRTQVNRIVSQTSKPKKVSANKDPVIRVSVATKDVPKETREFSKDVLSFYSSTIKDALDHPGTNHRPHVAKSGHDEKDGKWFVVLEDLEPDWYFGALEDIMRASKMSGIKKAEIPKDTSLWKLAMIFRSGVYLGIEYIMKTAEKRMRKQVPHLVSRDIAESIYHDFPANTLPRQMVIESIAEELLSQVLGEWIDENQVWQEVFVANFDDIDGLAQDVNKYYYHHIDIRRVKKAQRKAKYLAAEVQLEENGAAENI